MDLLIFGLVVVAVAALVGRAASRLEGQAATAFGLLAGAFCVFCLLAAMVEPTLVRCHGPTEYPPLLLMLATAAWLPTSTLRGPYASVRLVLVGLLWFSLAFYASEAYPWYGRWWLVDFGQWGVVVAPLLLVWATHRSLPPSPETDSGASDRARASVADGARPR